MCYVPKDGVELGELVSVCLCVSLSGVDVRSRRVCVCVYVRVSYKRERTRVALDGGQERMRNNIETRVGVRMRPSFQGVRGKARKA